jgi:hypothetical protein
MSRRGGKAGAKPRARDGPLQAARLEDEISTLPGGASRGIRRSVHKAHSLSSAGRRDGPVGHDCCCGLLTSWLMGDGSWGRRQERDDARGRPRALTLSRPVGPPRLSLGFTLRLDLAALSTPTHTLLLLQLDHHAVRSTRLLPHCDSAAEADDDRSLLTRTLAYARPRTSLGPPCSTDPPNQPPPVDRWIRPTDGQQHLRRPSRPRGHPVRALLLDLPLRLMGLATDGHSLARPRSLASLHFRCLPTQLPPGRRRLRIGGLHMRSPHQLLAHPPRLHPWCVSPLLSHGPAGGGADTELCPPTSPGAGHIHAFWSVPCDSRKASSSLVRSPSRALTHVSSAPRHRLIYKQMQAEERYGPGGYIYVGNGGYEVRLRASTHRTTAIALHSRVLTCVRSLSLSLLQPASGLPSAQGQVPQGQGYGAVHSG